MSSTLRTTLAVGLLLASVGVSQAQMAGGFGQRRPVGVGIRSGPYTSLTYVPGAYGFGFGPIYGPIPSWYYGYPGVPIINNPIIVQPALPNPVVIQNIIGAQVAGGAAAPGNGFVPPEFAAAPAPKAGAMAPKPPAKPAAPAKAKPPAPVFPPDPPKALGAAPGRADADRIAEAGRKAFADGQYGRALELFRTAAEITPNDPPMYFLIAQTQFALGKYNEAVDAIKAGVALRADWPDAQFVARELYWKKPELFDEHMATLRQAVAQFPNDSGLAFLLGHQLWFDGKRDQARPLFQTAAALAKGQTPAETFLK